MKLKYHYHIASSLLNSSQGILKMDFALKLFFFVCAVYITAAQPVEEGPKDGEKSHPITLLWKPSDVASDKKHHITLSWREANLQSSDPSEKKHHVTVSWKDAEAAKPSEGPLDRKHGFTVSWKGAKLEPPHEKGSDRKHHFTVSWKNASADAPSDRKHHITFAWRGAPGSNSSDEVGPDGRVHYSFLLKKEGADGEEKRAWWSFIPSLFSRNSATEGEQASVKKHHITIGWRNSLLEPEITTDEGSTAVISQEPVLYTTSAPASA